MQFSNIWHMNSGFLLHLVVWGFTVQEDKKFGRWVIEHYSQHREMDEQRFLDFARGVNVFVYREWTMCHESNAIQPTLEIPSKSMFPNTS